MKHLPNNTPAQGQGAPAQGAPASCRSRTAGILPAPLQTSNFKLQTLLLLFLTLPISLAAAAPPPSPSPAEDIRPIRGAVEIPPPPASPWPTVLAVAGGILALALLVALALWLKRRAEARRIPNLRQKAEKALEKARALMTPGQSREYSIAVSDIVRSFIEGRFRLPSTRRTTEEFLNELSTGNIVDLGPYRETLARFLHLCDLGKFAGYKLNTEEMQNLHQAALDVIHCETTAESPGGKQPKKSPTLRNPSPSEPETFTQAS